MSLLADLVSKDAVRAQLTARQPELLDDPEGEFYGLFDYSLEGIAAEVAAVTGDLPPEFCRALAVQAVVLGTAMSVESAMFPEQINGDSSRAEQLRDRYIAVLAQLKTLSPMRQRSARVGSAVLRNPWIHTSAPPAPLQPPVQPPGTYLQWDQVP